MGIRSADRELKKEEFDFNELCEAHWISKVSAVANRRKKLHALSKQIAVPATKDLMTFRDLVVRAIAVSWAGT